MEKMKVFTSAFTQSSSHLLKDQFLFVFFLRPDNSGCKKQKEIHVRIQNWKQNKEVENGKHRFPALAVYDLLKNDLKNLKSKKTIEIKEIYIKK